MKTKYAFFEFITGGMSASNVGKCLGMVCLESGEIYARVMYGLMHYNEEYLLNASNTVEPFPFTDVDFIILNARKAIKDLVERRTQSGAKIS